MEKIIKLKHWNNIYKLEVKYIAENRAEYYANKVWEEWTEEYRKEYEEEYNYTMEDIDEAYDWLVNNTDPDDFEWNIHLIETITQEMPNDWSDYEIDF